MKRGIIRAFWGIYSDDKSPLIQRRKKMDKDIEKLLTKGIKHDFVCYTYGIDNHKYLLSKGINSILINDNPAPYDLKKEQYLHKIKSIEYAMFEDGYDEILHCDWDCILEKPIPKDMWEILEQKESFQGCLQQYRRRKCFWRKGEDFRKIPNGGCIYIREKQIIKDIIKCWEKLRGPSVEPPMALYLDEKYGKWIGPEEYWKLHEIELCNLARASCYRKAKKPRAIFKHYI